MRFILIFFLVLVYSTGFSQAVNNAATGTVLNERYKIIPLNFNSPLADFSPFVLKNKLYFVSTRSESVAVSYTSASNANTSDIYVCTKIDSITFSKPKVFNELNTAFDDGPIMFSPTGNYAVFSASNKKGKLQIYFSVFENGKWAKPILHPLSRATDSYCHPFLMDEKTIFFSSDKAGGYGGMDIYYSRYENYNWTNPINAGAKVNTKENEIFPFISTDNQLYFSAKRDKGMGGLDIYSWDLKDSSKVGIHLLESPINSAFDDFGVYLDSTQKSGFFSSNRNTKENDNIFYFEKLIPEFPNCIPMKRNSCYTFFKDTYSLSDESKENEYEWDFGDGNKAKAKAVKHCYSTSGFYTVRLNVIEKESGKIIYNELAYTIAVRPQGLLVLVNDTLLLNTPILFDASNSQIDGHSILNYTWIFNDTSFTKGPQATHQYAQNGIYRVELGVEARNDATKQVQKFCIDKWILVGDKSYIEKNLKYFKYAELLPDADSLYFENDEDVSLSMQKNQKVFRFSKLGADAFGLNGEGDGDVALSEQERKLRTHKFGELGADGSGLENLSEEEAALRAKQRLMRFKNASLPPIVDTLYYPKEKDVNFYRVNLGWSDSQVGKTSGVFDGIEKLEETKEGNRYRYTSGKEKDFAAIVPYYENAKRKGFKDAAVVGFTNENISKGQVKNLPATLFDSAMVESEAAKVYFKYDVATYDLKYNVAIDALLNKIKNKSAQKIILITHFDGLGGLEYNTKLNTERTKNMLAYLVSKGIKKSLIKTEFIIHPTENLAPDLLRRIEVFLVN